MFLYSSLIILSYPTPLHLNLFSFPKSTSPTSKSLKNYNTLSLTGVAFMSMGWIMGNLPVATVLK